jgi:DNA-binding beta-propeller fold protein YncE
LLLHIEVVVSSSVPRSRATILLVAALLLALVPFGPAHARGGPPAGTPAADRGASGSTPAAQARTAHEVWSLDQGTDLIHIYDSRVDLGEVATIDVSPAALRAAGFADAPTGPRTVPHMIEFDSKGRYAFIAATAGGVTIVVDARAKTVAAVLPTGPGTHMADITPDDREVWVSVLGPGNPAAGQAPLTEAQQAQRALVRISFRNLESRDPRFTITDRVVVKDAIDAYLDANPSTTADWAPFRDHRPVCHQFTPDGREAWVTLGPEWDRGGMFVLDLRTRRVSAAWDPGIVRANCGVGVSDDGRRVVANWSGQVVAGDDRDGEWYVFDARTKRLLRTESARGLDAHGVRFSRDGRHIWAVNRNSDNALVIDARSFEVVEEYGDFADTPDILAFSPDDTTLYVTQRGPTPQSGAVHSATGDNPGLLVVSTATGTSDRLLAPPEARNAAGAIINDIHGVGVRDLSVAEIARGLPRVDPSPGRGRVAAGLSADELAFTCHLPG